MENSQNYFGVVLVVYQGFFQEYTIIYFNNHVPSDILLLKNK